MHKVPKYYIFRILFLAILLYFLLILPPLLFTMLKGLPDAYQHMVNVEKVKNIKAPNFYFHYIIFSLIIYWAVNCPIKVYLSKKRKGKKTKEWLANYAKKVVRFSPVYNATIIFVPQVLANLMFYLQASEFSQNYPEFYQTALQMSLVSLFSSFLVSIMVYLWQENRVRLNYLPVIFTEEELKFRFKKAGNTKIATNFLFSGLLTSFTPILIILFYLFLSATPVQKIAENTNNELTKDQAEILYGSYYELFIGLSDAPKTTQSEFQKLLLSELSQASKNFVLFYYTASDSLFMILGIGNSILVALFYIILINKLNARIVVVPIKELRDNMKKTAKGEFGIFNIVRTNNEIGSLAESFNSMSEKLNTYFTELTDLNKNLEQKVIERTAYIEQQKEEITAQRDEIEAQRDNLAAKNEEIQAQHEEVVKQRDKIAVQNRQITDSINYAQTIQTAILPPPDTLNAVIPEHVLFFKPRDIVSGDFYWLAENENKIIIAVADCTGHGVPGAMMSMLGVSILNEIAALNEYQTAADVLEELRKQIISSLNPKGAEREAKDGMDIALCVVNKDKKELQFAGANNPLYYFSNNELNVIKATRNPIGVYKLVRPFENTIIKYQPDDVFYMFSDGYRDQMSPLGERLKTKGFKELLAKIYKLDFEEQYEKLNLVFENWKLSANQTDDVIVLGFKLG